MPAKIMVVDDETDLEMLITQKFRRQIRKGNFEFVFAHNGIEALEQVEKHPDIDMILSDINMPEMDGLTLLSKLGELDSAVLRTVIVSAYGDMENIRTAMNRGAFDFVTKPINFEDLEITIDKTIKEIEGRKKAEDDRNQLVKINHDLSIAKDIQLSILKKDFPYFEDRPEFDVHAIIRTARQVGGDLYDFVQLDDDHFFFYCGDVSDKGISAAMFMAITSTLFRIAIREQKFEHLHEVVLAVNRQLKEQNTNFMFVTMFLCLLDLRTGEIEYVDAGHEPPFIIRKGKEIELFKKETGIPLGVPFDFDYQSHKMQLNPGDTILLYTDGATDANDAEGERFESANILKTIEPFAAEGGAPKEVAETLFNRIDEYIGDTAQFDDIAILTVQYNGR